MEQIKKGVFYNGKQIPVEEIKVSKIDERITVSFYRKKDPKPKSTVEPLAKDEDSFLNIILNEKYLGKTLKLDKYEEGETEWGVKIRELIFSGKIADRALMKEGSNMLIKFDAEIMSIVAKFVIPGKAGKADDILVINYSGKAKMVR